MAGEESGLDVGKETEGNALFEEGVQEFGGFAFLPGGEDGFSGVLLEKNAASFLCAEVGCLDLAAIEQGQSSAIGKEGAHFLHKVER